MKRYSILMVVVLMVLAVAWTAFGHARGPTGRTSALRASNVRGGKGQDA